MKLYPAIVSLAATTIGSKLMPSLSCIQGDALAVQTRNVHELVDHLRSRRIVRVMPVLVVRGGDPVAIEAPSVSMRILALPPLEVIRLLGDHMHALRVEKAAFLPTGIGSLSGIKFLCIDSSSLTSLPSEIARLALKKFWIERCEGLESLSECITAIPTLQTLAVHGCSKLKQDDPVISALQARGIAVDWA